MTRPLPYLQARLSDAAALDIATAQLSRIQRAQLSRIQRALIDGITVPGHRGKPRRLSVRDRDALLLDELDRALTELRRGRA